MPHLNFQTLLKRAKCKESVHTDEKEKEEDMKKKKAQTDEKDQKKEQNSEKKDSQETKQIFGKEGRAWLSGRGSQDKPKESQTETEEKKSSNKVVAPWLAEAKKEKRESQEEKKTENPFGFRAGLWKKEKQPEEDEGLFPPKPSKRKIESGGGGPFERRGDSSNPFSAMRRKN